MHDVTGVVETGDACITSVIGIGEITAAPMLLILASNKPKMLPNFAGVIDTSNASFAGVIDIGNACIAMSMSLVMHC
jgi:hypothetical protein